MRTTIDLPEDLLRRAKAVAALRGMKLKDLITALVEQGLGRPTAKVPEEVGRKGPLPKFVLDAGSPITSLTNDQIEELLLD